MTRAGAPGYDAAMAIQIRPPKEVEDRARGLRGPLTVDEFLACFPEVPRDLRDEPVLAEYVGAFGHLLRLARKPSPCMRDGGDAPHQFYLRLVNDLAIYGAGLAKRDRTLVRLRASLDEYRKDRKSTRLNSSHIQKSRMPSSA